MRGTRRTNITFSPPTIAASLNTRPRALDLLLQGTPNTTTTTSTYEHIPPKLSLPEGLSSLDELQLLFLRQRQREHNQQQQSHLRSLQQIDGAAAAAASASAASLYTSAAPASRTTSTPLQEPQPLDPRLVLLELQRHAGAAPHMFPTETMPQRLLSPDPHLCNLSDQDLARLVLLDQLHKSLQR